MSGLRIGAAEMAWLMGAVPVLVALYAYASYRRKRALAEFAGPAGRMNVPASRARRIAKHAMTAGAVLLLAAALCRPSWNEAPQAVQGGGRNVVFVLDVSRSMLARDVAPNRLERTKLAVGYMVDALDGERVALVAFAGSAILKCPLTIDYGFFKLALKELSPESVPVGGSSIGAAIRKACEEVSGDERGFVDIVLVSDGEDLGGDPLRAAREAGERGVRIFTVGVGDETEGSRIPVPDASGREGFLTYGDEEVWTRLDSGLLKEIAKASQGGEYVNASAVGADFGVMYARITAGAQQAGLETRTVRRREEKFQLFLALAFVLLMLERLIPESKRR